MFQTILKSFKVFFFFTIFLENVIILTPVENYMIDFC